MPRTAVLVKDDAVLAQLLALARGEEIALRPLVKVAMAKVPAAAALVGGDFAALRDMAELVLVQMDVFRRLPD